MESHLATIPEYTPSRIARLQSLYSDFTRQKQANPTAFASNVEWWYRLLRKCLEEGLLAGSNGIDGDKTADIDVSGDCLILHTGSDLPEKFRWDRLGRPLALPTVLVSAIRCFSRILALNTVRSTLICPSKVGTP
jgi:charged multivesicular body protein 7